MSVGVMTTYLTNCCVYYESIKREPNIKSIYEYRCDERLQTKSKEFTRLPYTGLVLELEHLKIEPSKLRDLKNPPTSVQFYICFILIV
jgi:hypothetical protein